MPTGEFRVMMMVQARVGLLATATEMGVDPDTVFRRFVYGALGYAPRRVEQLNGFCPECHRDIERAKTKIEDAEYVEWIRMNGIEKSAAELGMDVETLRLQIDG